MHGNLINIVVNCFIFTHVLMKCKKNLEGRKSNKTKKGDSYKILYLIPPIRRLKEAVAIKPLIARRYDQFMCCLLNAYGPCVVLSN